MTLRSCGLVLLLSALLPFAVAQAQAPATAPLATTESVWPGVEIEAKHAVGEGAAAKHRHTDADGGAEHNQDLSERRATSVRDWVVANGDIDPARLATEGRGESEPVAANDTPANKQLNRRVDVVIAKR